MNMQPQQNDGFCEMNIYPDTDLTFNVRVSLQGKSFVEGGFINPDEAQRRGVAIMLAMSGEVLPQPRQ